jgi:hypothetical protein
LYRVDKIKHKMQYTRYGCYDIYNIKAVKF